MAFPEQGTAVRRRRFSSHRGPVWCSRPLHLLIWCLVPVLVPLGTVPQCCLSVLLFLATGRISWCQLLSVGGTSHAGLCCATASSLVPHRSLSAVASDILWAACLWVPSCGCTRGCSGFHPVWWLWCSPGPIHPLSVWCTVSRHWTWDGNLRALWGVYGSSHELPPSPSFFQHSMPSTHQLEQQPVGSDVEQFRKLRDGGLQQMAQLLNPSLPYQSGP